MRPITGIRSHSRSTDQPGSPLVDKVPAVSHAAEYVAPGTATMIANIQRLRGIVIIAAPPLIVGPARGDHDLFGIGCRNGQH